jgi:hypothetical protein
MTTLGRVGSIPIHGHVDQDQNKFGCNFALGIGLCFLP